MDPPEENLHSSGDYCVTNRNKITDTGHTFKYATFSTASSKLYIPQYMSNCTYYSTRPIVHTSVHVQLEEEYLQGKIYTYIFRMNL